MGTQLPLEKFEQHLMLRVNPSDSAAFKGDGRKRRLDNDPAARPGQLDLALETLDLIAQVVKPSTPLEKTEDR